MRGKMSGLGRGFGRIWTRAGFAATFAFVLTASLTPASWAKPQYKTLHRFRSGDRGGRFLHGGLVADPQGNLYGTTWKGGSYNDGTVFELASDSHGGWKQ